MQANSNNNNNNCVEISSPPIQTVPDIVVTVVDDNNSKSISNSTNANNSNNNKEEPEVKDERATRKPLSSTAKLFGFVQKDPADRPQTNTSKIFGPRTRDMNKGYLTFSDEAPGQTSEFLFFCFSFF